MAFKGDLEALVLGVLQDGDLHGYEIAKRIKQLGADALQVWEGQLYPALHKLEKEGSVTATWAPQEGKPPRKIYSLTALGRERLCVHQTKWHEFATIVDAVMSPRNPKARGVV